jgi:hypothetical protein
LTTCPRDEPRLPSTRFESEIVTFPSGTGTADGQELQTVSFCDVGISYNRPDILNCHFPSLFEPLIVRAERSDLKIRR